MPKIQALDPSTILRNIARGLGFCLCLLLACPALADDSACAQTSSTQLFVTPCFDGGAVTYWFAGKEIDPASDQQFEIEQVEGADPLPYEPQEQQEQAGIEDAPSNHPQ